MSKVTLSLLKKLFPGTPNSKLSRFVSPFNTILPKYGITDKNRFSAFIANVGVESDHLKALEEYASGGAYEGRKNLGNVRAGDGVRYKGRSVLQTTGRYNYFKVVVAYLRVLTGKDWDNKLAETNFDAYLKTKDYTNLLAEADKYNVNFLENPTLLAQFPYAVEAAGVFVKDKNLNSYADKKQFFAYAGILNTGSATKKALNYTERKALYDLATSVVPNDFNLDSNDAEEDVTQTQDDSSQAQPFTSNQNIDVNANEATFSAPEQPLPAPQDDPVTLKSVTTSLWTKVVAAITAVTGIGLNIGDFVQSKLENITPSNLVIIILGVALVVLAVFYYKKRQEAADKTNQLLINHAADTTKNTVTLHR